MSDRRQKKLARQKEIRKSRKVKLLNVEQDNVPATEQVKWARKMKVGNVVYYQTYENAFLWRAEDGSNRVVLGPEEGYYYVSHPSNGVMGQRMGDYFLREGDTIDDNHPGVLEHRLLWSDGLSYVKKADFPMKDRAEELLGKKFSWEEIKREFNRNPSKDNR